ncbi:unnamed protein product [Rotaria sordida]|uniref:DUF4385 domain-containing protein n=1 Tax=Rotaria sordida TaxID=392033 RepID=A0A818FSS1_9BILA|nr:unnamed protein product [Rotaria sordida]CAF0947935.1 unnamed protein product [Rotaria sordida]CAF1046463.1 unnamed protein product [Rotaria sordida]CAF1060275.1 unnamed protein product [Rotaria sordida]CAF1155435.1 unnamed protein product [Rotaria sordida]
MPRKRTISSTSNKVKQRLPSYLNFNHKSYDWKANIDYRKHPELYRIGRGEQGVLICQPYKNEICPYWRFKTVEQAIQSSNKIYELFLNYLQQNDFVGADMARKYLQMGFTRSRRYANHASGIKYDKKTYDILPQEEDHKNNEKAQSANIFKEKWFEAKNNELYKEMATKHRTMYEIKSTRNSTKD